MKRRVAALTAAAACLVLASAAGAATPFTAGAGNFPDVAVDSSGIGRSTYGFAPAPNRVVIVTHRCCEPDATLGCPSPGRR